MTGDTHSSLDQEDFDYETYWAEFSGEYKGHNGISSLIGDNYLEDLSCDNDELDYPGFASNDASLFCFSQDRELVLRV